MQVSHLRAFVVAGLILLAPLAKAESGGILQRKFDHTAWRAREGAPTQIFALAQTNDGYLWLGTANGLFRFDGVHFELYRPPHDQRLLKVSVQSLLATPDGGLWVGYTLGGTSFIQDGQVQNLSMRSGTVWAFTLDSRGSLYAATSRGVFHYGSKGWGEPDESIGLNGAAYRFLVDSHGTVWMATDDFLYRKEVNQTRFEKTAINAGSNAGLALGPDGTVWITDGEGVRSVDESGKQPRYLAVGHYYDDLTFDHAGGLWAVSLLQGVVYAAHPGDALAAGITSIKAGVDGSTSHEGLSADTGNTVLTDREGNVWIATDDGLDRFREAALERAPLPSTYKGYALSPEPDGSMLIGTVTAGLQRLQLGKVSKVVAIPKEFTDQIECVLRAPDGKLWLGGSGVLGYLDHERFVSVPLSPRWKDAARDTQAMTVDHNGDLWMQIVAPLPLIRLHSGVWTPMDYPPGPKTAAVTLTTDHTGRVWAGYMDGLVAIYDKGQVTAFREKEGITVGNVTALYESGSQMWIGGERGLEANTDGHFVQAKFVGDQPITGISGLIRLADGSLWVNSLEGVLRVPSEEVEHFLSDPGYGMNYRIFGSLDGLYGKAPQLRPLPSIAQSPDGRLWFATANGAFWLDPSKLPSNKVLPPVHITAILADGASINPIGDVNLPKGTRNLEFDYTALSLTVPERVRFRYKLEGFDTDWQEAGTRRQAFYTHLPPAHYVFRVIACNDAGLWNNVGASLPLILPPTFLQSWYFKALAGFLAIFALWALVLYRIRQTAKAVRGRLYERFSERERIARDLHDTFFQGIQGLLLSFQSASRGLPSEDPTRKSFEETLAQSDRVMLEGRELVLDLRMRSVEGNELNREIEVAVVNSAKHSSAECRFHVSGEAKPMNGVVSEELYKISREALNNACRHSEATSIEIRVAYMESGPEIVIQDNGVGISREVLDRGGVPNHWGLPGIRERAKKIGGTVVIESAPGEGTRVRVTVPATTAYQTSIPVERRSVLDRLLGRDIELEIPREELKSSL
jgi:signal transduction histidine kinase/ligand-binding sensor domain-containing protein